MDLFRPGGRRLRRRARQPLSFRRGAASCLAEITPLTQDGCHAVRSAGRHRPGQGPGSFHRDGARAGSGPGEAVVKVQACGVCHTDLHYREGGINDEFPFLLGHEAAGRRRGGRRGRHRRRARRLRHPQLAGGVRPVPRLPARPALVLLQHPQRDAEDDAGRRHRAVARRSGIGAFAEKTLVAAGQCTKVDPRRRRRSAGLLGCGVMAGIGAAINTGGVGRGDTVAVIGCGGVGDAAIAGRPAGRRRPRSSRSTSTTASWSGRAGSAPPHTVNSDARPTRSRRSGS